MKSSAAHLVKDYLEKYVFINLLKTRKNKHIDPSLARTALSIAYDIIHEMESLIRSNNANDFDAIRECIRRHVGLMHQALKTRQSLVISWFTKTTLPSDFATCVHEAWFKLQSFEKHSRVERQKF